MAPKFFLYRGQTFKNFTEFNTVFQSHCKEFGQRYNESGCPVQEINSLIQDRSLLFRSDFVFSSVTYKCVQNASCVPFPWSSGVPRSSQSAQVTCSAGLTLTAIRSKDIMEITSLNLNHNHPSAYLFNCNSCQEKFCKLKELKEHNPSCPVKKKRDTELNTDHVCSAYEEKSCSLKDVKVHRLQCSLKGNSNIDKQLTENDDKKQFSSTDMHQPKDLSVQKQDQPAPPHFLDLPNKSVANEVNKSATAKVVSGDAHTDRPSGFETNVLFKEEVDDQSYALSLNEPCAEPNHLLVKVKEEVHEVSSYCNLPVQNESLNDAGTRLKEGMVSNVINNAKKTDEKFKKRKGRMAKEVAKADYSGKFTKLLPKSSNSLVCSNNNEQHQNMNSPRLEEVFFTKPKSGVLLPAKNSALAPTPASAILPSSQPLSPCNNYLYPNLNPALQVQLPHVASPNILPIAGSTCQFAPFVVGSASFQLPHQPSIIGTNTLPLVTPLLNTGTMINPSQALSSLAPPLLPVPKPQNASTGSPSKDIHTSLLAPCQNMTGQVNTGIVMTTPPSTSPLVPQIPTAATTSNVSVMPSNPTIQTSVLVPGQNLNASHSQDNFFTMGQVVNTGQTEVDGIKIQNCIPLTPGTIPNPFSEMQTFTTPVSETLVPVVLGNQVVFMKQPMLTSSGLPVDSSSLPSRSLSFSTSPTYSSVSSVSGQTGSVVTSSPLRPPPPLLLAAPARFQNPQMMPMISTLSLSSPVTLTSSRHPAPLPASCAETSLTSTTSKAEEENVKPRTPLPAQDVSDRKNLTNSDVSGKPGLQNNVIQSLPEKRPLLLGSNETQHPQPLPAVWGNHAAPQLPSSSAMALNNILLNNVPILPKGSEMKNAAGLLKEKGEESYQNMNKIQSKNTKVCSSSAEGLALKEGSEMNNKSSKMQTDKSAMFVGPFSREEFNNILSNPGCLKKYVDNDTFSDCLEIGSKVLALPLQMNSSILQQEKGFDNLTTADCALKEPSILKKNDLIRIIEKSRKVLSNPVPILPATCFNSTISPCVIKPKLSTAKETRASTNCETLQTAIHMGGERMPKDNCDITDQTMSLEVEEKPISSKLRRYKLFRPHKKFMSQKRKNELNKQEKTFQLCMSENVKSIAETDNSNLCPENALLKLSFYGDISLLHKALQKSSVVLEELPDTSLYETFMGRQMDNAKTDHCHTSTPQSKHKRKYKKAFKSRLSHNFCLDSDNNENNCENSQLGPSKNCRKRRNEREKRLRKWTSVKASDSLTDAEELDLMESEAAPIQRRSSRIGSRPKLDYSAFETKAFIDLDVDFESGLGGPLEISLESEGSGEDTDKHTKFSLEEANCGSDEKEISSGERQGTNKPQEEKTNQNMLQTKHSVTLSSPSTKNTDNINKTLDSSSSKSDLSRSPCSLVICTDSSLSSHSLSTAPTDGDCNNSPIKLDEGIMVDSTNSEITEPQEAESVHYSSESDSDMFSDEQKHVTMKEKRKVIRKHINEVTMFFIRHTHLFEAVHEYDKQLDENEERYLCKVCKAFKTNGLYCLRKHLKKHLNGSLKCPSCHFEAWSEGQLTNHRC